MVIDEKGLMAAMKDAYKGEGYKVAVEDSAGCENVILHTAMWTVVVLKKELPRKVLAMIVEHVGEIPQQGQAWQVKKKEVQTEIFQMVDQAPQEYHSWEQPRRLIRKTNLVLGGCPLWQTATEGKVVKVQTDYEEILRWWDCTVRLVGDYVLMADDEISRAYIRCTIPKDTQERQMLEHLANIKWVSE